MGYYITEDEVREIAARHGWKELPAKDPTVMIFHRNRGGGKQKVNVWLGRMTVGTYLKHPKWGKSQLFRPHVDRDTLQKIFENPRVHAGTGYYEKWQRQDAERRAFVKRYSKNRGVTS